MTRQLSAAAENLGFFSPQDLWNLALVRADETGDDAAVEEITSSLTTPSTTWEKVAGVAT